MIWLHAIMKGSRSVGQCGSVVGAERGVEGVLRWVEGEGKANGVMMGGGRKRGRGRRSDLYRSGSGCGTCGAGLRSDTGRKGGARMLQSVPKFGPPGGPANPSTLLFP